MQATAELQVVPIDSDISLRKEVGGVVDFLKGYDFIIETHASGANIEGELSKILSVIEDIHMSLH